MIYDPPLSAFEEEVIFEVASFKEEGLVTPKDEIEKKESWKYVGPWGELNPGHPSEIQKCWPLRHPDIVIKQSRMLIITKCRMK